MLTLSSVVNANRGISEVILQVLLLMNKGGKYLRFITLSEQLRLEKKGGKGESVSVN